jgi:hypothetical protein
MTEKIVYKIGDYVTSLENGDTGKIVWTDIPHKFVKHQMVRVRFIEKTHGVWLRENQIIMKFQNPINKDRNDNI